MKYRQFIHFALFGLILFCLSRSICNRSTQIYAGDSIYNISSKTIPINSDDFFIELEEDDDDKDEEVKNCFAEKSFFTNRKEFLNIDELNTFYCNLILTSKSNSFNESDFLSLYSVFRI